MTKALQKPRLIESISVAKTAQGAFKHHVVINGVIVAKTTQKGYADILAATLRRLDVIKEQRSDRDVLQTILDMVIFMTDRHKAEGRGSKKSKRTK